MSIIDKKSDIFGKIAAKKTLTEGMPKFRKSNSFKSVNNKSDIINFLTDIIISVLGFIALVKAIVEILSNSLKKIEKDIKKYLKLELKACVSCGIDPSLPPFLKSTGSGIIVEIKKIDFNNLFKIDATTKVGKLLYNDVISPLTDSTDFNTFLYGVIQDDGNTHTWKDIFDITFNSVGTGNIPNNTLTIKANPQYDNKSLNDLNNDFINSITLFNVENIISRIIDIIFGSISFSVSKSRKQLEEEEKVNRIIDKMIDEDMNTKEGDSNSDNFFTFSNEEMSTIENRSNDRQRGVVKVKTSQSVNSSVPSDSLVDFNEGVNNATTAKQKKDALENGLNNMANDSASNIPFIGDRYNVKLNFFQSIINNLIKAIVSIILSPKVVMIFIINYRIIYGPTGFYTDAVDFIKKNNKLFKQIIKRIAGMIIKILLAIAMKKIMELVAKSAIETAKEKAKNKKAQLLSLAGVPKETLEKIKNLS